MIKILCGLAGLACAAAAQVSLTDAADVYTMANGALSATIDKQSGTVTSLRYRDLELLGEGAAANSNGYWSLPGTTLQFGKKRSVATVDDPARNGGARATVACVFQYDGAAGSVPADVELRYSLARGDTALYLEAVWRHRPEYPALNFPVGRFAAKLNDAIFDWMTVDARRNMQAITAYDWNHGIQQNMKEARLMTSGVMKGQVEHKYDYAAVQFDTPAYGWSSTGKHVGLWMVSASNEYMSGGPTKLELSTHRDATFTDSLTAPAPPVILNVWKGPHYGATSLVVAPGEEWSKTIGPFLLYANAGPTPDAMWRDSLARAQAEAALWPYDWVTSAGYPHRAERATVSGRVVLSDPLAPAAKMSHLLVGLAHADYTAGNETVDWQKDGKYYQYWVRGDAQGGFAIPHVRPGEYTLHAFADGVLGEYVMTGVKVTAGQPLPLGELRWTPVRFGRQLWEIGIPDRTAGEFLHGDRYWEWGIYNRYPKDFPNDVRFIVGQSDYRKDWNLMQVPRGPGQPTAWTVTFQMPEAPHGTATLRLAFAGTEARQLAVEMNDRAVGTVANLANTGVIHRDADRGYWAERAVSFDAASMKAGTNVLKLTVPGGSAMSGIEYDYLRLELDEGLNNPARPLMP